MKKILYLEKHMRIFTKFYELSNKIFKRIIKKLFVNKIKKHDLFENNINQKINFLIDKKFSFRFKFLKFRNLLFIIDCFFFDIIDLTKQSLLFYKRFFKLSF